jgi:Spy/CpxP family protein refolding chaperone
MTLIHRLAIFTAASLVACALSLGTAARAQNAPTSQRQLDIAAARAQRKATVGANMNLTDAEATKFWPVYDAYEAKMDKIEDRHVRELKDFAAKYDSLTEGDAAEKLDEVMAIAQARLDTQKDFVPKFRDAIPQVKVTRFFQIDNKIQALIQCDIAQLVPLAHSAGEGQSGQ